MDLIYCPFFLPNYEKSIAAILHLLRVTRRGMSKEKTSKMSGNEIELEGYRVTYR